VLFDMIFAENRFPLSGSCFRLVSWLCALRAGRRHPGVQRSA